MVRLRHPNILTFMGLCPVPPCILTGEAAPPCLPFNHQFLTWQQRMLSQKRIASPHSVGCRILRKGLGLRFAARCSTAA